MKLARLSPFLGLFLILATGCSSSSKRTGRSVVDEPKERRASTQVMEDELAALLEGEIVNEEEERNVERKEMSFQLNGKVRKWIEYFTLYDRERFQRFLKRGQKYREVVQKILEEHELPPELYYLAMIESGYQTHARSRASAVGAWQFIRGTGKRYGLQTNHYVDERRDPIQSTEAAAKYLKDLHNVFQSWYLALAAYNAGERRIMGAIMRAKSRDYWTLVQKKVLPRETANYVPKFLAAVAIGRDPEKFGFKNIRNDPYPDVEAVALPAPVRLRDVAKLAGIGYEDLKKVNPHIRRGVTPPYSSTYEVWIPEESVSAVKEQEPKLATLRVKGLRRPNRMLASVGGRHYHRVRRGETLSTIARRYKVSVRYLKRINSMRSNRIVAGKRLRVSAKSYHNPRYRYYRVRKGDNLVSIARRFGTSVRKIKRLNGLRFNRIYAGQSLKIAATGKI